MSKQAIDRVERYIAEYEDAPSWGGPTMYPAPPSLDDLRLILALAKANIAGESQVEHSNNIK